MCLSRLPLVSIIFEKPANNRFVNHFAKCGLYDL